MTEQKESINIINNPEEQNIINEPIKCYYCHLFQKDLDIFSCEHKICSICLFRRIFLNNIKDLKNEKDEIEIKCKCNKGNLIKSIEEIFEINNKKNLIYAEKYKNRNNSSESEENSCTIHGNNNFTKYCVNCSEELCSDCLTNNTDKHLNHNICPREDIINRLKIDLMETKLQLETKDDFENKWNEICNKIKEESQNNFEEAMHKIEEVAKAIIDFRKDYEEKYQKELTKVVKILKLYKLFYLNYYFEKNSYKESKDINYLRYIFSFPKEISSINIITNRGVFRELENIKTSINLLKLGDSSFKTQLNFTKIKKGYKIEQIIEKSHEKLLNGIFEINENKILTGSLDFSMKIWQEVNNKFENIKKIKGQCGAICSMAKLSNGNIVTTAANNNNINIWSKSDKDDNFIINQSLSSHTKPVLTIAELQSGKLLSGGWDNLIIIWDRDINGSYLEKQRIKDKTPITKIISLDINKFAFTSENRIRIMIQKKKDKENINNKKELNDVFDDLEFDQNIANDEEPFICCFKLSKHVGRVKCLLQMRNGYLISGGADMSKKKDNNIIIWKPNDLDGFFHLQTLEGHKSDINGLIELKDGRLVSSSKDRTIRIWKSFMKEDKNKINMIQYQIDEILDEHKHGIYFLLQINDGRIISSTSESALVIWKDNKYLSFC